MAWPMMPRNSCHQRWLLSLVWISSFRIEVTSSFAYAPNFITKIIEEQTAIAPIGLLQIDNANINNNGSSHDQGKHGLDRADAIALTNDMANQSIVKTRFPPEPNGYLHLGHAKAVSFNFAVARMFGGVCHMRLDDTNPSKEDSEYVESILEDVKWVQEGLFQNVPWDGPVRKTSDYFDLIYDCAVSLVQSSDAYVDSLTAEEMKEFRGTLTEPGKDSPYRSRTIQENMELLQGMKDGKFPEGAHVLRAKIDMASPNINMRDPTLYRIKHESHQETGDKWCIYPMYDFSHPIADAIEQITHSLCTLEFEDHRPFYDWTIEKLIPTGLISAKPQQIEFSRLNIQGTVLSKRKLIQLVQERHVEGWDDPRMPTLSGLRRRGLPATALRLFCERVGISKADSNIEYTALEDCVREVMDSTCPRAFSVLEPLKVTITNWGDEGFIEEFQIDRHPKVEEMGKRTIPFGKTLFIERSDFFDVDGREGQASGGTPPKGFKRLLLNDRVRLRYTYVIECNDIKRSPETNEPVELLCTYFPESRAGVTPEGMARIKGIIHWVEATRGVRCQVNQYDRLFETDEPGKASGNFLNDLNSESLQILKDAIIEPSIVADARDVLDRCQANIGKTGPKLYPSSLAYQFERSGYFALDKASTDGSLIFNRVVALRDTWGARKHADAASDKTANLPQQPSLAPDAVMEDIRRVAFRAVQILSVEPHPEADGLLVCKVDCGDVENGAPSEPRTVVAGLAGKIPLSELIGRKVVAITNLKPAKMRGIESTAMILAASDGATQSEKVELLQVPEAVPIGELIMFEGKSTSEPDAMMKSKGALKAWERVKSGLRIGINGDAIFVDDGVTFRMITSSGPIKSNTLKDVAIQ